MYSRRTFSFNAVILLATGGCLRIRTDRDLTLEIINDDYVGQKIQVDITSNSEVVSRLDVDVEPDSRYKQTVEISTLPVTFHFSTDDFNTDYTYTRNDCASFKLILTIKEGGRLVVGKSDPC